MEAEEKREACCCGRLTHRDAEEKQALIQRLNRIEGQIRGIRGMVERDAYCVDILTQVSAAGSALDSFTRTLLATHIQTCVARDIREEKDGAVEELITLLQRLMK